MLKPLEDVYVNEGETASFQCVTNRSNAVIKWSHIKEPVYSGIKYELTNDEANGKVSLKIHDAEVDDAGSYTVVVGDKTSTAKLHVKEASTKIVSGPESQTVKEKATARFEVKLNKANHEPTWLKNGKPLKREIGKVEFTNDGCLYTLIMKKCLPEVDDCQITFRISEIEADANLKVIPSEPIFVQNLNDVTVMEGEKIVLKCESDKDNVKAKWTRHEGAELVFDSRIKNRGKGEHHSIEILNAEFGDEGIYSCILGKNASTAMVTVLGKL